jgi:predicted polyphosphate/ATP-dependent NAD kinase
MSAWDAVKVIVPLIGIAIALTNVLGLWATVGQTKAREERRQWAEQDRQREEEQEKFDDNVKRIERSADEHFRRMEAERFSRPR